MSSASPPASAEPRARYSPYWHLVMMGLLYVGQGFIQGLVASFPQLVQTRRVLSLQESTLIYYPIMPFSFKFLWSPLVDGCYWTPRTRRPFWVIVTQLAIISWLFILARAGDEALTDSASFTPVVASLAVVVFFSATQDMAVDAWTIEGVPKTHSSLAATTQNVGLTAGFMLTQAAVVATTRGWISLVQIPQLMLGAYVAVLLLLCVYLWHPVGEVSLPPASTADADLEAPPTVTSVLAGAWKALVRRSTCRRVLVALLAFPLINTPMILLSAQAVALFGASPSFLAETDLALGPLVTVAAHLIIVAVNRRNPRPGSLSHVVRAHNLVALVVGVLSMVLIAMAPYLTFTSSSWASVFVGFVGIMAVLGEITFCLSFAVMGGVASQDPSTTGTIFTVMASIFNFGRSATKIAAAHALLHATVYWSTTDLADVVVTPESSRVPFLATATVLFTVGAVAFALFGAPCFTSVAAELDAEDEKAKKEKAE